MNITEDYVILFNTRYNKFSNTYLLNYDRFTFEVKQEMYDLLLFYEQTKSLEETARMLKHKYEESEVSPEDVSKIIANIYHRSPQSSASNTHRHIKICNFNFFNPIIDIIRPIWLLIFLISIYFIINTFFTFRFDLF